MYVWNFNYLIKRYIRWVINYLIKRYFRWVINWWLGWGGVKIGMLVVFLFLEKKIGSWVSFVCFLWFI